MTAPLRPGIGVVAAAGGAAVNAADRVEDAVAETLRLSPRPHWPRQRRDAGGQGEILVRPENEIIRQRQMHAEVVRVAERWAEKTAGPLHRRVGFGKIG